jgi:hypothetical protein
MRLLHELSFSSTLPSQNHLFVESYLASFGKHISRRKSVCGF